MPRYSLQDVSAFRCNGDVYKKTGDDSGVSSQVANVESVLLRPSILLLRVLTQKMPTFTFWSATLAVLRVCIYRLPCFFPPQRVIEGQ